MTKLQDPCRIYRSAGCIRNEQTQEEMPKACFSNPRQHKTQVLCVKTPDIWQPGLWNEQTNSSPVSPCHQAAVTDRGPQLSSGCQCVLIIVLLPCLNSIPAWPPPLTFPYSSVRILPPCFWMQTLAGLLRLSLESIQPTKRESCMKWELFAHPWIINIH